MNYPTNHHQGSRLTTHDLSTALKFAERSDVMGKLFRILISSSLILPLAACGGGSGPTHSIPVTPPPSVNLSFSAGNVAAGQPAILSWSSSNVTACAASGSWSDTQLTSGSLTFVDVAPGNYSFTLTCTGNYGSAAATASATVSSATAQVKVPLPGAPAACASNCYYVDANLGSDQNNGLTPSSAFQTLQMAANTAGPGAAVTVAGGTYTDTTNTPLVISTSGTAGAPVQFIAGTGQHPIIQIPNSNSAWYGIQISASYIVIDGFEVIGQNQFISQAQGQSGDGSQAWLNETCIGINGASTSTIPHDIVIRNSTVHDCSEAGIGVVVGDAITIAYNTVYNNSWWTWYDSSGISLWHLVDAPGSTTTSGYKNWVVGNTAWNNYNNIPNTSLNPPGATDGNAIIIDDNRHTQSSAGPTDVQGIPYSGRTYVANNVVYNNGGRGLHAYSSAHVDFVNNTTYNDLLTNSQYISMEIDAQSCYDVNVVNNIADNLNGKQADETDGGAYWNNLWYGANVPTLGTNGLNQDPEFTNAVASIFTPAAGSPALASGTAALAPSIDIAGQPRNPKAIDRGAIQVSQ
jgi:hypothetical protein